MSDNITSFAELEEKALKRRERNRQYQDAFRARNPTYFSEWRAAKKLGLSVSAYRAQKAREATQPSTGEEVGPEAA